MTEVKAPKFNPQVSQIITSGPMYMDAHFAFMQMMAYMADIDLLQHGVPYQELGIAQRRHAAKAGSVMSVDKTGRLVVLANEENINWLSPQAPGGVAQIRISGGMYDSDGASHSGMGTFADSLALIDSNPSFEAAIVEFTTGGVQVTAANIAHDAIASFSKPIFAKVIMALSAGYYAASACDEIWCTNDHSEVGSIGVLLSLPQGEILKEYLANWMDIYSKLSPNKNNAWRDYTKDGSTELFEIDLDDSAKHFQNIIKNRRSLRPDTKKETLQGGVFYAQDGKRRGLVDGVGNTQKIMNRVQRYLKLNAN